MKVRQLWTAVLSLLLLQGLGASAADDLVSLQLRDQARMWQSKDRDDLAAEAWSRLLLGNPQHGEAIVSMGMIKVRSGDMETAKEWYARATRLKTTPLDLGKLASALAVAQPSQAQPMPAPIEVSPVVASKPMREREPRKKAAVEQDAAKLTKPKASQKARVQQPTVVVSPPSAPVVPATPVVPVASVAPSASTVTPAPVVPSQEPALPKPRPSKALPYFPPL